MTRAQQFSTFRIPRVPYGLIVVLTGLVLIGGMILLTYLAGADAVGEAGSHPVSTAPAHCEQASCLAREGR